MISIFLILLQLLPVKMNYDDADILHVQNIIVGNDVITSHDLMMYDFDNDGKLTAKDIVTMQRTQNGLSKVYLVFIRHHAFKLIYNEPPIIKEPLPEFTTERPK